MSISSFSRRIFLATLIAVAAGAMAPGHAADFASERVSVTTEGEGSDVILIHGLGSSPRVWREMIRAVPGFRYHLVHIHGFAGKERGQNAAGQVLAPVAADIARYVSVQGLKRPAVIGHSMGGSIGMMLAARHPDALSKLMVIDMLPFLGTLFGPPGATAETVKPVAEMLLVQMRTSDPVSRQARSVANLERMIDNAAMRPAAVDDAMKSDPDVVARAYHELIVTDLRPELPRISVPTTVLYVATKVPGVTEEQLDARYLEAYSPLKGATLKRVAASAHFIMWDQPQQFQADVRRFLGAPVQAK